MSSFSHNPIRIQPALDRGRRPVSPAVAALMVELLSTLPTEASGGYVFESALCFVESQSPLLRSALGDPAPLAMATLEEREAHALLSRTRMVARLLVEMRSHLDAKGSRALLDAAKRVVGELATALSLIVARASTDPAPNAAEQASEALAEARLLADGIGLLAGHLAGMRRPAGRFSESVH